MKYLTDDMISGLSPAETSSFPSPVPTQIVSSDEFEPVPQTAKQREVEARLTELSDRLARRQGISRRRFFQTASGMAASFVALNQVFGPLFDASEAEAATPEHAAARAEALSGQMVIDGHTHFLRDDTRLMGFVKAREAVGKAGWNKDLGAKEQTIDDLKYSNYIKEIYMDSDTKVALLSDSPSQVPEDWFIPQEQVFKTRELVNKEAGSRRMLAHFTFTPGWPGWLDQIDEAIERFRPDSWKGYSVGDNTHKELDGHPWHADDEKLMYPFYEKIAKTGIRNVCIHKGLFAPAVAERFPRLLPYADVSDIGRAAKDWPQLNFLVYHSGYRWVGGNPADGMAEFDKTGRSSWVSDLAEIPEKFGVNNVYGDLGQLFAWTSVAEPRLSAALMGICSKASVPSESFGARTRFGPARRNGKLKACDAWKSPWTCKSSTASNHSVRPTARSRPRSSVAIRLGCTGWKNTRKSSAKIVSPPSRPTIKSTVRGRAICGTDTSAGRGKLTS